MIEVRVMEVLKRENFTTDAPIRQSRAMQAIKDYVTTYSTIFFSR